MHSRNKPEFKHYAKAIKSESKHACNTDIITNLESDSTKFFIIFKNCRHLLFIFLKLNTLISSCR